MKIHEIGDHTQPLDAHYWFQRAKNMEQRCKDLGKEIQRLRGLRPLSAEEIATHNAMCAEKAERAGI